MLNTVLETYLSMQIKITITGPESSGKTTLSRTLAEKFNTLWVPEYARDYINQLHRPYEESDLLEIARGQLAREDEYAQQTRQIYFCDTSLEVIKIWSEFKFKRCHPWILEQHQKRKADFYLLCAPDLPWEDDPQRENPDDREELFEIYQQELSGEPVQEVWGGEGKRLQAAEEAIRVLLP
ncbi:NadR type nicotinamide-nucleotide adenylyltransferase [Catalinimonas alkaloidigena]|nr:NadR type nicotinamide-nucleotide adenylyltransferase [Catalinimonas alkaloidigena]